MAGRKLWSPDRCDMIWINCNPPAGRELKEAHPLLVLSPKAFNERTGSVIGLPMTTASFNDTDPFAVKFVGPKKRLATFSGPSRSHSIGGPEKRSRTLGSTSGKMCSRSLAKH
jgi:hypothetical protein